jgi:type IV pilus assembly protein PilQ
VSGTPINSLASLQVGKGLKVGYLDSSLSVFVKALETIGDTNVIATPRILALNKMRAEILIGAQLGYVSTTVTETSTTQAVQFLEVGTQLRIRPFISNDGMIRMEVHPELSTGIVRVEEGLTLPDKEVTGVTTNIMARDGSTVVIGGLIREDLDTQATQIPWLGSLPLVGPAFRQQTEKIDRREIIVLITPRIVCDAELNREGNHGATEFHHRQAVVGEKMSPLSRNHLSNKYMYLAQQAWSVGNQARALRLVNLAIHFNPQHRAAIDLRADIVGGVQFGDHTGQGPFLPFVENPALDRGEVPEFILEGLDPTILPAGKPLPKAYGTPGEEVEIPAAEIP